MHDPAVIYADPLFVVVDKPAGMLSVPGKGESKQDCVISRVARMFPQARGPMVIHRLDMDTSGLILVALDPDAQRTLSKQFEDRRVEKKYIALVRGIVPTLEGVIDFPMRPDVDNRPWQIRDDIHGRTARTHYKVLAYETDRTRLEFSPVTGRAHQLRVHAAHPTGLNRPILGDVLYSDPNVNKHNPPGPLPPDEPRLMLHASFLSFEHPATGVRLDITSECPF